MAAGPWVGAATAVAASAYMAQAAYEREKREMARHRQLVLVGPRIDPPPAKCPGCGSHEFRQHHGRTICAYCRVKP